MWIRLRLGDVYIKLQFLSKFDPYHSHMIGLKCLVLKALYHCTIGFLITFTFWKIWWFGKFILAKSEPHDAYSRDAYKKNMYYILKLNFSNLPQLLLFFPSSHFSSPNLSHSLSLHTTLPSHPFLYSSFMSWFSLNNYRWLNTFFDSLY